MHREPRAPQVGQNAKVPTDDEEEPQMPPGWIDPFGGPAEPDPDLHAFEDPGWEEAPEEETRIPKSP